MEVNSFVAIDFETATSDRYSICEIGLCFVHDGNIVNSTSWLVQPPGNEYDGFNTYIHGIDAEKTVNSPLFPEVWKEVMPLINNHVVVAHNTAFDMYALRDALDYYKIEYPDIRCFCSMRLAKQVVTGTPNYTLPVLYTFLTGKEIDEHHRAESDAKNCAEIFLKCLELAETQIDGLEEKYHFTCGSFSPGCFIPQRAKRDYTNKQIIIPVATDTSHFDENSYFYGKSVCFTGSFSFANRQQLLQWVADIGGIPTNSVTSKTDILVVGQQDFRIVGSDGMSSKQKKALQLLEKGQNIEILSESDFLQFK
jgi:DNA polymerase-3 subunit epsilon